jgi:multidrug resistance efflux pump
MSLQPSLPTTGTDPEVLPVSKVDSPNGTSLPRPSRIPKGRRASKILWFVIPGALVLMLVVGGGAYALWFRGPQSHADLSPIKVEYRNLQLKVVERGTLEAKDNHDIKCEVKTGSRGAPKIKWVVENGTMVQGPSWFGLVEGDLLAEIDDSYLQEQATNQKIVRDRAETDKVSSELLYPSKQIAVGLAEKQLDKWIKGDFPQQLHTFEGQIQQAESTVLQQEDRTAWASRMVKKNYMTASQAEAEQATLTSNKLSLQQYQEQKKVLTDYTDTVNKQDLKNKIVDAQVAEQTAKSDMLSKKAVFDQQEALYKDLIYQIDQCRVKATYTGIVVYAIPEQSMRGVGSSQSIIAQGEPVAFGQKMMSVPDLSHMLVNLRVHEAFINHMRSGLPATVRVEAVAGKTFKGHVKSVANVAAAQDWMSPDVKVYQAYVEIDDSVEQLKLKPGLSANVTIFTELKAEHVLAVPVQAVVAPAERGSKPRCYVITARGTEPREVELGLSDGTYVEVKSGLNEGEDVSLTPRALQSDQDRKGGAKEDDKIVPTEGGKKGGKGGPDGGKGGAPGGRKG